MGISRKTDHLLILFVISFVIGVTFVCGCLVGRAYQRLNNRTEMQQAVSGACEECSAGGEQRGLDTCRDVLQKEDENGNY